MAEHTKLPWNVRDHQTPHGGRHIWIEGGEPIGQTRAGPYKRQILEDEDYDEKAADAALIVKAVNNHDEAISFLELASISLWRKGDHAVAREIDKFLDRVSPESRADIQARLSGDPVGYSQPSPSSLSGGRE